MDPVSISRVELVTRPAKERRAGSRDRRLLDGTMKYRGEFAGVEVINLSEHGAYIQAPFTPELYDIVTLTIGLPDAGGSVMISGRVRRVSLHSKVLQRHGGFGVEFTRFYTSVGKSELGTHLAA
jgi:hypothetical protein